MKFVDTSFLIDFIRGKVDDNVLIEELENTGPHVTNTIVQFEFLAGGYGSKKKREILNRKRLLERFILLPIDEAGAEEAAIIFSELKKRGDMIGQADIIIAGTMRSRKIIEIVSRNVQHFEKIEGIKVISWKRPNE
jgi:tRNA(fMet)-specific endonuclease VapC